MAGRCRWPLAPRCRYSASARYADGSVRDVTTAATWQSAAPQLLSVDAQGRVTGRVRGEARVTAFHQGAKIAGVTVLILEDGTYKLSGRVVEGAARAGVLDATVEVVSGTGSGLRTRATFDGSYALYGVQGSIRLQVTKLGYADNTHDVTAIAAVQHDVEMVPVPANVDISGQWRLTLSAPVGCRQMLPAEARERTFTVSITQTGTRFRGIASGPALQYSEPLDGRVFDDLVVLPIFYYPGDVLEPPYYGLINYFGDTKFLGIFGEFEGRLVDPAVVGTLTGGFHYYPNRMVVGQYQGCDGDVVVDWRR